MMEKFGIFCKRIDFGVYTQSINQSINHTILTCAQKRTSSQLSLPHGTI